MKHSRLAGLGAMVAVAAVVLSGCSGNPDGGDAPAAGAKIENVVVAVGALPDSLTPSPWGGSASHVVLSGLGSQLLAYEGAGSEDSCLKPSTDVTGRLAESAELSPDGAGVIIKLRDLTSQWGNKLSAEDVAWSLEIGMVRQPVMKGTLNTSGFDVDNLTTIIDPQTVQLNTKTITSYTLASLQNNLFYIHDSVEAKKHATAEDPTANDWLSKNLADYSGWELEEFTPGTSLTLKADEDWEGDRGSVKRLVVKAASNTATRSQLVEAGEAQVAGSFEYDQYASLAKAPGVEVLDCVGQTRDTLMMNTTAEGPLSDPAVRRAISQAIDREALVKGAYAGFADPSTAIFPGVDPTGSYAFDKDAAKKALADAGYPDGFSMELSYSATRPGPVAESSAVLVQSMLGEVGIKVELKNIASSTDFSTAVIDGRYQAILYSEPIVINDPAFYSYAFYAGGAPSNSTGWADPRFDETRLKMASVDITEDERKSLMQDAADYIDEGSPILALVQTKNMLARKAGLTGAVPLTNGQIHFAALGS